MDTDTAWVSDLGVMVASDIVDGATVIDRGVSDIVDGVMADLATDDGASVTAHGV